MSKLKFNSYAKDTETLQRSLSLKEFVQKGDLLLKDVELIGDNVGATLENVLTAKYIHNQTLSRAFFVYTFTITTTAMPSSIRVRHDRMSTSKYRDIFPAMINSIMGYAYIDESNYLAISRYDNSPLMISTDYEISVSGSYEV